MAICAGLILGASRTAFSQSVELVAAARQEGAVTVYMSPGYKTALQGALDVWGQRYPGIKVNIIEAVGAAIRERIRAEHVGGNVVGEHSVIFAADGERIVLTHIATDRGIFARGAIKAALWGRGKGPGLFSMADVLGM